MNEKSTLLKFQARNALCKKQRVNTCQRNFNYSHSLLFNPCYCGHLKYNRNLRYDSKQLRAFQLKVSSL